MTKTSFAARAGRTFGTAVRGALWLNSQINWTEVGQIVWHGLLALAVATYVAGEMTGRLVHRLNDRLAALASARIGKPANTAKVLAAPAAAAIHPMAELASELEAMSVKQLRVLTGVRRKLAKHQLVALALAC